MFIRKVINHGFRKLDALRLGLNSGNGKYKIAPIKLFSQALAPHELNIILTTSKSSADLMKILDDHRDIFTGMHYTLLLKSLSRCQEPLRMNTYASDRLFLDIMESIKSPEFSDVKKLNNLYFWLSTCKDMFKDSEHYENLSKELFERVRPFHQELQHLDYSRFIEACSKCSQFMFLETNIEEIILVVAGLKPRPMTNIIKVYGHHNVFKKETRNKLFEALIKLDVQFYEFHQIELSEWLYFITMIESTDDASGIYSKTINSIIQELVRRKDTPVFFAVINILKSMIRIHVYKLVEFPTKLFSKICNDYSKAFSFYEPRPYVAIFFFQLINVAPPVEIPVHLIPNLLKSIKSSIGLSSSIAIVKCLIALPLNLISDEDKLSTLRSIEVIIFTKKKIQISEILALIDCFYRAGIKHHLLMKNQRILASIMARPDANFTSIDELFCCFYGLVKSPDEGQSMEIIDLLLNPKNVSFSKTLWIQRASIALEESYSKYPHIIQTAISTWINWFAVAWENNVAQDFREVKALFEVARRNHVEISGISKKFEESIKSLEQDN